MEVCQAKLKLVFQILYFGVDSLKTKIKIGDMAKLHKISTQTLRFYDQIDLFKPRYQNPENLYRYYDIEQFAFLDSILFLRELGMPIDDIKKYFENRNLDSMINLLITQENNLKKEIFKKNLHLLSIQKKISLLKNYQNPENLNKINIKNFNKRLLLQLKIEQKLDSINLEYGIKNLFKESNFELSLFDGLLGIRYKKSDFLNKIFDLPFLLSLVFDENLTKESNFSNILPAGKYLTLSFRGLLKESSNFFNQIYEYIEKQNILILSDPILITISDCAFSSDEDDFIHEIQIHIK